MTDTRAPLAGFGNHFQSEAVPGTLPIGRNSPQRVAQGLYAEQLSGTAFTAPRAENRRSWLYRRQPSAVVGSFQPLPHSTWKTGAAEGVVAPPDPLRWHPVAAGEAPTDFITGMHTVALNGDADMQAGMAAHLALFNQSMQAAFINADGELLVLPQQGTLTVTTELGVLSAAPGQVLLLPRGLAFRVAVDGPARAYVCENYGAPLRLPELGPIGSNGLAAARDFIAPHAAFEDAPQPCEIVRKHGGRFWRAKAPCSPFNVVAWHGNLVPFVYDTAHFNTIGSISFDHPDPSIFTVLTSPSDTPGMANLDFVIFPPRWLVMEDSFRPPWYHRNLMSEFMGLVQGEYDAKPGGFKPGGMSLHNAHVPHGPDAEAFAKASTAALAPQKLDHTLAFMFETRYPLRPTAWALDAAAAGGAALDRGYADCWATLGDHFGSGSGSGS
jgi:homogentisate 1,2-dioxygenase